MFERLGRTGADPADLDAVLLTHLHIDHSGGLAPVVFAAWMSGRDHPLAVLGPAGDSEQPGVDRWAELLFGPDGAWSYLHSLDGFGINAHPAPSSPDAASSSVLLELDSLRITFTAVSHSMMPTLAYRIDTDHGSVTFSGDVQGYHPPLAELARDTTLLVHDMALPERDIPHGQLHVKPSEVGRLAADAGATTLLLTHVMPELEDERDDAERLVRESYYGDVMWASDLQTVPVG